MAKKLNIAILLGGKSPEHEISMISGRNIFENIDRSLFNPYLLGIDTNGIWHWIDEEDFINNKSKFKTYKPEDLENTIQFSIGSAQPIIAKQKDKVLPVIDVVFSVLHGGDGENGSIQGFLQLLGLPYTGPDVLGAAVNMDKEVMKKVLKANGIASAKYVCVKYHDKKRPSYQFLSKKLGSILIVKPCSCGSSVGVHKVDNEKELQNAINDAFKYDQKLLIEECLIGQEVECAVLGNYKTQSTMPGEVVTNKKYEFYDYQAKYLDPKGAEILIPSLLDEKTAKRVKRVSKKTYEALYCKGYSRVDSFVTANGKIYINEINTLPGFTSISMYPKLWGHEGLSYSKLITKLINLALERKQSEIRISTQFV